MSMGTGTGRTFDFGDESSRKTLNLRSSVQVTLIHKQVPNMHVEDNVSETDPDWENMIEFTKLQSCSLLMQREYLID